MGTELIRNEGSAVSIGSIDEPAPSGGFNLRLLLQVLRQRGLMVLVLALAGGLAAGYYARNSPAKFQAKAVLQVEQEQQKFISIEEISRQDLRAAETLNTIVQNIKNSSVMLRVAQKYHLGTNAAFLSNRTNQFTDKLAARFLGAMVTAKLRPETRLIDVTVTHPNPEMAQTLANAVAGEFINQVREHRVETTRAANDLLYQEAVKLKDKLETAERRIDAYSETNQTLSIQELQLIVGEKLKQLTTRWTDAKAERLRLEAELKQLKTLSTNPEALLTLDKVRDDPAIGDLRRRIAEQQSAVATLSQRYKPKYPKMMQAQRQLDDLRETLRSIASSVPISVSASYDAAMAREKNLEGAFKEAQQEAYDLEKKAVEHNVLVREVQPDRALYDSVLKRFKEVDLSKQFDSSIIMIVEPAERPTVPIKMDTKMVAGGTFATIFFACMGLLYLLKTRKGAIQTVDDAESLLGLPVWAAIPRTSLTRKKGLAHVLVDDPGSICAEGFRTLRTLARMARQPNGGRIQMFTSADPSEGKTFCSVNHAICHAQQGSRTLLIDLDLRRPSLGRTFGIPEDAPGVTDCLTGSKTAGECVQMTRYANLFILPAGPLIESPAEELAKDVVGKLLEELANRYDQIVIDTAPILSVSDTFLVLPLADTICLVVRTDKTPRRVIQRALELMARANVPPSGIVLNFLPKSSGHGYYYYGSDRRYGKKGVYEKTKLLTESR